MGTRLEISSTVPRVDPRDHQQAPKRPHEATMRPNGGPQTVPKRTEKASNLLPRGAPEACQETPTRIGALGLRRRPLEESSKAS